MSYLGTDRLDERDGISQASIVEGGGLTGGLVHVNVGVVQQLVGDDLVVEYYRYSQWSVFYTVN